MSTYIDHISPSRSPRGTHSWQDFTHKRLFWLYGPDRAWAILKGNDRKTQVDLERWNALGRRSAA